MRRSVREALVGFSLLAGVAGGVGLWLWLKGVSLTRDTWSFSASFSDAAGLAARSPVVFRGVLVGHVSSILVLPQAVVAELEINHPDLLLARPVVARVGSASLLGGDAQVSLISAGMTPSPGTPGPRSSACDNRRLVCRHGQVQGVANATIDSVTETVQRLLDQAERDKLVDKLVSATTTFAETAREADKLSREGQQFLSEARQLVGTLNRSTSKLDPILSHANAASIDFAQASRHIRNLTAALDNPRTVADLQATLSHAKQLTDRWSAVGGDVRRLTEDPQFIDGIRHVSVGLGRFFQELYPAETAAERDRQERARAARDSGAARTPAPAVAPAP